MRYLTFLIALLLSVVVQADQAVTVNPTTHVITQPIGSPSFGLANGLVGTTGTFTLTGSYDFSGGTLTFGSKQIPIPLGNSVFVDAVNGNDSTGAVGSQSHPFLTIGAAVTAANAVASSTSPVVVKVGPGTFTETSFTCSPYVSLIGSGIDATTITSSVAASTAAIWNPGSHTSNGYFTITSTASNGTFSIPIGPYPTGATNHACVEGKFYSIKVNGLSDCVYANTPSSAISMSFYNCILNSYYDAFNLNTGWTGCYAAFYNCVLNCNGTFSFSNSASRGVVATASSATIYVVGCQITATGGTNTINSFGVLNNGANVFYVVGTDFNTTGTGAYDLSTASGGTTNYIASYRADGTALTMNGAGTFNNLASVTLTNVSGLGSGASTMLAAAPNTSAGAVTQAGGDARYVKGQVYYAALASNYTGATGTSYVNTTLAITLPAGRYEFESVLIATTASTTAGINAQLLNASGDYFMGTFISNNGITGAAGQTGRSGASTFMISLSADAPTTEGVVNSSGVLTVGTAETLTVQMCQRTTTDGSNPPVLLQGSYIKFTSF